VEGPRYPRILAPCAHTFCTECIERQIAARGSNFECLLHNSAVVGVAKATDAKANFALIELMELVKNDVDHQQVDDRAPATLCSECDKPAEWYCLTDDACFCEEHKVSVHSAKSLSKHTIVPVVERHASQIPKCPAHKTKELDVWCRQCEALCCLMCAHLGDHKAHPLAAVESVAAERREKIAALMDGAEQLVSTEMDEVSLSLVSLRNKFGSSVEGTARAIDALAASTNKAIATRLEELHQKAREQGVAGLKNLQLRIEDLTACRSQASAAAEEAKRVLRMNDHAVLKHSASVVQSTERSQLSWATFKANSSEPQPMQFLLRSDVLQEEIAVAGKVFVPVRHVKEGVEMPVEPGSIALSGQGTELHIHRAHLQSLHAQLQQRDTDASKLLAAKADTEARLLRRDADYSQALSELKDMATQLSALQKQLSESEVQVDQERAEAELDWEERVAQFLQGAKIWCRQCRKGWTPAARTKGPCARSVQKKAEHEWLIHLGRTGYSVQSLVSALNAESSDEESSDEESSEGEQSD
jgi:hypothetical protein